MIQIPQPSIASPGVPSNDVMDETEPTAAQPDPWAPAAIPATTTTDPLARFNALFGTPPQVLGFYADKNGAGGKTGTTPPAAPRPPLGGPKPPVLQLGSYGPAVRTLQQELNKWRAEQSPKQKPIAEDGRFTRETKKAVEEFQKANTIATGTRKFDLTPNGIADVRVQKRLRLENDAAFAKLSPENKKLARDVLMYADQDGARSEPMFTLFADPAFGKIGEYAQAHMLEAFGPASLHADASALSNADLAKEYGKLLGSAEFHKLGPAIQASIVARLTNIARPDASTLSFDISQRIRSGIDNLVKVCTEPGFGKLPADEQRLLLDALATSTDQSKFAAALTSLLHSPRFDALKPDEKTAVVNQVYNYSDHRSVANIERMLAKDWFRTQDLSDKQRSLKTIAYLSQHDKGNREVIDNTIEKLVGAGSDLKLRWDDLSAGNGWNWNEGDAATRTFGEADASTRTLTLSSAKIPDGNKEVPNNYDGRHLALHTVAHEVNHLVNKDTPRNASFQHFEIEYRAWAVGFKAEHGHWPTNKEAMVRVRQLLTATDGAYADIKGANRKYHDAMAMYSFLREMTGWEITAGNLDEVLRSTPDTWRNRSRDPDERAMKQADRMAPIGDGNRDNS